jgi:hypothetical protein
MLAEIEGVYSNAYSQLFTPASALQHTHFVKPISNVKFEDIETYGDLKEEIPKKKKRR